MQLCTIHAYSLDYDHILPAGPTVDSIRSRCSNPHALILRALASLEALLTVPASFETPVANAIRTAFFLKSMLQPITINMSGKRKFEREPREPNRSGFRAPTSFLNLLNLSGTSFPESTINLEHILIFSLVVRLHSYRWKTKINPISDFEQNG